MADGLLIRISADAKQALDTFRQVGNAASGFATNVGTKIKGGMDRLGSAFSSFKTAAAGAFSGAASALFSFVNPVQLGIIAITAISVALINYITKLTDAEKAQQALNKAMEGGAASVQGEIADINALARIIGDETLSRKVRQEALNKANKDYPETFQNLKLDANLHENLAKAIRETTASLTQQAQVKALIRGIDEAAQRKVDAAARPLETLDMWDKVRLAAISAGGATGAVTAALKAFGFANANVKNIVGSETAVIDKLTASLNKLRTEQATAGTLFKDKAIKEKTVKDPAKHDAIREEIRDLEELERVTGRLRISEKARLQELKVQVIRRDKGGLDTAQVEREIQALKDKFSEGVIIPMKIVDDGTKDKLKDINTELAVTGRLMAALSSVDVKPVLTEEEKALARFTAHVAQLVNDAATNIVSGLGEAIGTALAGGDVSGVFNSFLNMFADGLTSIGKAAIAWGIGVSAIMKAIKSLDWRVAIGAGVALVALGAFLKAKINSQPKFAEGGIVTGPTSALVGEKGTEVIFPLSKLNKFITQIAGNNGTQVFIAEHRLEGSTIVTSYRRETNRIGGTFS